MTGLQKIIKKIEEESAEKCNSIIKAADMRASQLISEARNDANKTAQEIIINAQSEADRIISVAKSSAETVSSKKYLEIKNAVINDIISASYEKILTFSTEEYFDVLYSICVKYVETGECIMYLNSTDLQRLPDDFENRINSTVYEKAAVQVSKKSIDIENGFILDYGTFTVDCTLKTVFDENKEILKDMLRKELFSEEI